jgi:uncharacterized membrane protein
MRAWTRGEKIGFFSLLIALVTCVAVVVSLPPVQVALGLRADPRAAELAADASRELAQQMLDEQRKLLGEQLELNRAELRKLQEERMEIRKQRIALLAKEHTVDGKPEYDTIALHNECSFNVAVALHYRDLDDQWVTRGWWTIEPGKTVETDAMTRNSVLFFYAENEAEGWRWDGEGQAEAIELPVVNAKFDHLTTEAFPHPEPTRVRFYERRTGQSFVNHVERFACLAEAPPDAAPSRRTGRGAAGS